uniref:DNA-directed DNA polymerase n=1 Tax=Strigamia maritima TaxID=126957 RepID=T1IJI7_STRMM
MIIYHHTRRASKAKYKYVKTEKLIPNLYKKEKYVLHHKNYQLYSNFGVKITNIDRVLVFEQRNWIKSYIDFNIQQRQKATTDFAKAFWKLMNNSVFGKSIENLLNRVKIKLAQTEKGSRKLLASPRLKDFKIFNNDLVAFNLRKKYVYLNRPSYVGATILEISKNILTSFYYNYIKRKYADNVRLLFTDTDSLTLLVHTPDFY